MKDPEPVQRLIRLKRYESPGETYYAQFLADFKDRQRSELLKHSACGLLAERVSVWYDGLSGGKWLVPAGGATAALLVAGLFFGLPGAEDSAAPSGDRMASASVEEGDAQPGDDPIRLSVPDPDTPVPELDTDSPSEPSGGVLPAGVRGGLREL